MHSISLLGFVHLFAGSITLLAGLSALLSIKGTSFHRLNGRIFVCFMLVLTITGLYLSIQREILFTVFLALLTMYSFLTGWATMSSCLAASVINKFSPNIAFCLASGATFGGLMAIMSENGALDGLPYGAFFFIAGIAICCLFLDIKHLRSAVLHRHQQVIRHIWRMGFSLFLSTTIFFFGNNNLLPECLQTPMILSAPVVLVVCVTAAYLILVAMRSKRSRY